MDESSGRENADVPDISWRPVAIHGRKHGLWAGVCCAILVALYVRIRIALFRLDDHNEFGFWLVWLVVACVFSLITRSIGYPAGFIVSKFTTSRDVASAVTATIAIASSIVIAVGVAVFLYGGGAGELRWERRAR